jgi:hypothetical protein
MITDGVRRGRKHTIFSGARSYEYVICIAAMRRKMEVTLMVEYSE